MDVSRPAGALLALLVATFASRAAHASGWSDWWWTRDQQAQRLLRAGDAARASQLFSNPRWRAYAGLHAGQYAQAAAQLAPFHDGESEYNRGNALAGAGQLQQALSAYDSALRAAAKGSPLEHDARHNREVVARQLKQQQQQQQGSAQAGHSGANESGGQGKPGAAQATAGKPGQPGETHPSGSPGHGDGQGQAPSAANTTQPGAPAAQPGAQQASGDALAGVQSPVRKPETEQDISLDQWLRQIPDDPAGLLQRKFLVEHLLKQRGGSHAQ
jgi:Ca-activated chloride channel homolog